MSHLLAGGGRPAAQPRQLTGGLLTQQHVATRVSELPGHVASSADPQLGPGAGAATGAEGGGDSAIICAGYCLRNLLLQHPALCIDPQSCDRGWVGTMSGSGVASPAGR